jgi:predicted metal-dependent HD superfamily phosphohydrolase
MTDHFHRSWQRAWAGIGATGDGQALRDALLARYREPQRHYHTQQHLGECLAAFEQTQALAQRPHEVEMALWFHDAIYEVRRSDNEQCSADWARESLLQAGVEADAAARVHALIMMTLHSAMPVQADEQLLVDIDLSILGAARARFDEYEQQIRREYAFVPGFLFRRKRRAILQGFLQRERIYSTAYFHDVLEARALANLQRVTA